MALHLAVVEDHEAPPEAEEPPARFEIMCVPRGALATVWPKVAEMLAPAVELNHGQETLDDILDQCADSRSQLWVVIEGREIVAAVTTCVIDHPRFRACRITYLGGRGLKDWAKPLDAALQEWARGCGCKMLEFAGREGWVRALRDLSYQQVAVILHKEL